MTSSPTPKVSEFVQSVRSVIEASEPGEVMTYGEVAAEAGFPGAARAVGGVLRQSEGLCWWRVVAASGRLVPGLEQEHEERLTAEGVIVRDGRVRSD